MRDVNWNKVQASRKLGITRTQLYMRLRKYGLEDPAALAIDACEMANASAAH
jgi:DNA-binding NtrC family response regulator